MPCPCNDERTGHKRVVEKRLCAADEVEDPPRRVEPKKPGGQKPAESRV